MLSLATDTLGADAWGGGGKVHGGRTIAKGRKVSEWCGRDLIDGGMYIVSNQHVVWSYLQSVQRGTRLFFLRSKASWRH